MTSSTARTHHATAVALARRKSSQSEVEVLREANRLLEHKNMRLQQQIDALQAQLEDARRDGDMLAMNRQASSSDYPVIDGVLVGNQRQFCQYHGLPLSRQYKVSRWVRDGLLKTVASGGRHYVVLAQPLPAAKRGNKNSAR
jgi:hypothetical protein